ncbi:MAG TPA: vWA domain-containing protein [Myxococcota bacterium]|nr:vWA domain-containing protein [Myxococcota bacterium]
MRFTPGALAAPLLLVAAICSAANADAPAPANAAGPEIKLTLDTVDVVRRPSGQPGVGFLSGTAFAFQGELELFDVIFVLDTSGSTAEPSGLGGRSSWIAHLPGMRVSRADSILGAEVASVESLLDGFDPRTTRVGIVSFAGDESPYSSHASTDAPLTSDYQEIRDALAERMLVAPEGGTDLAAGLLRAAIELLGTKSADSKPRAHATKHAVVLTDGLPTLPAYRAVPAARRAARSLANHDIRVHIFAIGSAAEDEGREIEPVATVTHGEYHAVKDVKNLAPLLKQIEFRSLKELRVANKTTGAPALELNRDEHGAWSALVPFISGPNQIEVIAVASDGREQRIERELTFGNVALDADQKAKRDRLMQLEVETEDKAKAHQKPGKELTVQPESAKP